MLDIKAGKFEYDELLKMAEEKRVEMEKAFKNSTLPDRPDLGLINELAFKIRDKFYGKE
ncbi:MAG: hypothetical protein HC831_06065 [Chloroflexia bacterium]|nr:hypothetical protein [Chloroflexia bacterium]